jgi:hypothetical protein
MAQEVEALDFQILHNHYAQQMLERCFACGKPGCNGDNINCVGGREFCLRCASSLHNVAACPFERSFNKPGFCWRCHAHKRQPLLGERHEVGDGLCRRNGRRIRRLICFLYHLDVNEVSLKDGKTREVSFGNYVQECMTDQRSIMHTVIRAGQAFDTGRKRPSLSSVSHVSSFK